MCCRRRHKAARCLGGVVGVCGYCIRVVGCGRGELDGADIAQGSAVNTWKRECSERKRDSAWVTIRCWMSLHCASWYLPSPPPRRVQASTKTWRASFRGQSSRLVQTPRSLEWRKFAYVPWKMVQACGKMLPTFSSIYSDHRIRFISETMLMC